MADEETTQTEKIKSENNEDIVTKTKENGHDKVSREADNTHDEAKDAQDQLNDGTRAESTEIVENEISNDPKSATYTLQATETFTDVQEISQTPEDTTTENKTNIEDISAPEQVNEAYTAETTDTHQTGDTTESSDKPVSSNDRYEEYGLAKYHSSSNNQLDSMKIEGPASTPSLEEILSASSGTQVESNTIKPSKDGQTDNTNVTKANDSHDESNLANESIPQSQLQHDTGEAEHIEQKMNNATATDNNRTVLTLTDLENEDFNAMDNQTAVEQNGKPVKDEMKPDTTEPDKNKNNSPDKSSESKTKPVEENTKKKSKTCNVL